MKFAPKLRVGLIPYGILTIAALGSNGLANSPESTAMRNTFAVRESFLTKSTVEITPAVELISPDNPQIARPNYIPVTHWYKSKHWWKRNAPIVGGAAGGALIGGLAGGGTGALIGGAAGGGGGALYKHYRGHNHHRGSAARAAQPAPNQPQPNR
jgi:hypothetical protein